MQSTKVEKLRIEKGNNWKPSTGFTGKNENKTIQGEKMK